MAKRRGWKWDAANNRLVLYVNGTEVARFEDGLLSFHQATAVNKADAYTQTYATATRTHAAETSANFPAGGTGAAAGGWDTDTNRDLAITRFNALRADVANLKQIVNSLIDDLQEKGLVG